MAHQWVEWGDRVHGGFGSLIALGVRLGNDALVQLKAQRREILVEYSDGPQTPCACVLDGIAVAVSASLGQRTLKLNDQRTEEGLLARVKFTHRQTQQQVVYELPISVLKRMGEINQGTSPIERFEAVQGIDARELFRIQRP